MIMIIRGKRVSTTTLILSHKTNYTIEALLRLSLCSSSQVVFKLFNYLFSWLHSIVILFTFASEIRHKMINNERYYTVGLRLVNGYLLM